MKFPDDIYEPAEDSDLLLKHAKKEIKSMNKSDLKICEVGVGSGHVIRNVAKKIPQNDYFGSDINPSAIYYTKKTFEENNLKINLVQKPLLEGFDEKFDVLLFNAPYLPMEDGDKFEDLTLKDKAIYGGKHGYEPIEDLILQVEKKLDDGGFVLLLFSSLSNLEYIEDVLEKNLFDYEVLEKENVFFEDLICLKFWKSDVLKEVSSKVDNIKYLAKGKHSLVLDGSFEGKSCIIKVGEEKDLQIENIFNKKLENESFVPEVYYSGKNYIVREKFEGEIIEEFLETNGKESILDILDKVLEVTFRLDELGINKQEMTNPYKHIFILDKAEVMFIDYERCLYTQKPKNTTQFLQYIRRNRNLLEEKGIEIDEDKIFEVSKKYKENMFKITMDEIISEK